MIDAERMFRFWRRVLCEDALQAEVLASHASADASSVDPVDAELLAALKQHREAARWPIRGYRFRLLEQGMTTMQAQAPITAGALERAGRLRSVVENSARRRGWRDPGWQVVSVACDMLEAVAADEPPSALRDAVVLELAQNQLLLRLAPLSREQWGRRLAPTPIPPSTRYQLRPSSVLVALDHDLAPWIVDPAAAGVVAPNKRPNAMLVYVEDEESPPQYARLTEDGARLYRRLESESLSLEQAAAVLGGGEKGDRRARAILTRFAALGIVEAALERQAAEPATIRYGTHWAGVAGVWGTTEVHPILTALIESVAEACGALGGRRVLDAGCGDGYVARALAERGAIVLGADLEPACVALANSSLAVTPAEVAQRISFRELDLHQLDLPARSFDFVTAVKQLWCLADLDRALGEFHRVLRPGGALVAQLWANGDMEIASLASSVLSRFVAFDVPATYLPARQLTAAALGRRVAAAGFAEPGPPRRHQRRIPIASAEAFWHVVSRTADTLYSVYITQPPDVRAAIDEVWRMEIARLPGAPRALTLEVTWSVVVCSASG